MKKILFLLLCCILAISLSGCSADSKEEYYETTLFFEEDGKITDVIVESFDSENYSEDGLKTFFNEKISDYNSTNIGKGEVELKGLDIGEGRAKATLLFDSCDTYNEFYSSTAYYGSINDAYDKGLISETVLKKRGSSETITKNDLMGMQKENIIIVSEIVRIKSPKKIEYTSANVDVIDERNARVSSDSAGLAYIVVK